MILIVGAGLSGATLARQLTDAGYTVRVIEKRNHIAGNCYDEINEHGIRVSRYGAHIFHTASERVWAFVQRFAEWTPWYHEVLGRLPGHPLFPIPVNRDTINILCGTHLTTEAETIAWLKDNAQACENPQNSEEVALSRVGPTLYRAIFESYTQKQWDKSPAELAPSVLARIPVRTTEERGYFSDPHQALPTHGYTAFVAAMLQGIQVDLETPYRPALAADYEAIFYTGPIDEYFKDAGLPALEYRSIRFETEHLPIEDYQGNSVVNDPSMAVPYTRIVEYKHFLKQPVKGWTTIVKEYSVGEGEPYYPVPTAANQERYEAYRRLAEAEEVKGVRFVGRLANYKYYNMDQAILAAMECADEWLQARVERL
jgi:UDP-galactopyranose mutase